MQAELVRYVGHLPSAICPFQVPLTAHCDQRQWEASERHNWQIYKLWFYSPFIHFSENLLFTLTNVGITEKTITSPTTQSRCLVHEESNTLMEFTNDNGYDRRNFQGLGGHPGGLLYDEAHLRSQHSARCGASEEVETAL